MVKNYFINRLKFIIDSFFFSDDRDTITFDSHSVSKSDSSSELSVLDPSENATRSCINPIKLHSIVKTLGSYLNMSLYGVDIVVENDTNRHAIIDINAYPGKILLLIIIKIIIYINN